MQSAPVKLSRYIKKLSFLSTSYGHSLRSPPGQEARQLNQHEAEAEKKILEKKNNSMTICWGVQYKTALYICQICAGRSISKR